MSLNLKLYSDSILNTRGVKIEFASWWSISETNNQKISMLGRDAHMISSMIVNLFAISYVNSLCSLICHNYFRESACVKP